MNVKKVYFKVNDMRTAVAFWIDFLGIQPHKQSKNWYEFRVGDSSFGLLLNDFGDKYNGSNCVPVFEFLEIEKMIEKAKSLGAEVVLDGMDDPKLNSVVFKDPEGNEFEVSKLGIEPPSPDLSD